MKRQVNAAIDRVIDGTISFPPRAYIMAGAGTVAAIVVVILTIISPAIFRGQW